MRTKIWMVLLPAVLLAPPLRAQHDVPRNVMSGGGGVLIGDHQIYCTVGEPVAYSPLCGASHECRPGFWYLAAFESAVEVLITAFACEYDGEAVRLSWSFNASAGLVGTSVHRAEGEGNEFLRLTAEPLPPGIDMYVDTNALPGRCYRYYILAIDVAGSYRSQTLEVDLPPKPLTLYQNYPNPFNPSTTIGFFMPEEGRVTLTVLDVQGKRVRALIGGTREAGRHLVPWDGRNDEGQPVGSGIYYYRLSAGKKVYTKKLVVLR